MYKKTCLLVLLIGCWVCVSSPVNAQNPPAKPGPKPPAKNDGDAKDKDMPAKEMKKDDKKPASKDDPGSSAEKDSFRVETFDGVMISGDFYPPKASEKGSNDGKKSPCVILLHGIGGSNLNSSRKDFGRFPEALQKLGCAVVTFDFRGYGESKQVDAQKFYNYNQPKIKGKFSDKIDAKDYKTSSDLMMLINDITAVKVWLNKQNNAMYCNSNQVVILGVEHSAMIGTGFAVNEHIDINRAKEITIKNSGGIGENQNNQNNQNNVAGGNNGTTGAFGGGGSIPGMGLSGKGRFAGGILPANNGSNPNNAPPPVNNNPPPTILPGPMEGEDIYCIISISTYNRMNDLLTDNTLNLWYTKLRDKKTKFYSVYGEKDTGSGSYWNKLMNIVKPANQKNNFPHTGTKSVKNTSLSGIKLLLNEDLEVQKILTDYIKEAVIKCSTDRPWAEQKGQTRPSQINLRGLLGS